MKGGDYNSNKNHFNDSEEINLARQPLTRRR